MRRHSLFGFALVALAGWTCSQQPTVVGPADGGDGGLRDAGGDAGDDAREDGGTDAGVGCGNPLASLGMDCGTLSWATSPVTSRRRNHQLSFIAETDAGPALYVLGGLDSATGFLASTDLAPINPDGTLGAFSSARPLKLAVAGAIGGLVGNVFVIAGGHTTTGVTDQSFSSILQPDGTLGPWMAPTSGGSILHPRMHGGSVVFGQTLYLLGGFDGNATVWSDIVSATVNADGSLSTWATVGTLPQPLSHFSAARVGNHVFLAGGLNRTALDNPPELTAVYQGTVQADGTLGGWVDMTPLPVALATHASFVYGGYLYVAGGINGTPDEENRVWSAPIGADGTLGAWQLAAPLPAKRAHVHQIPMFENHFYSVAGAIDFNLDSTNEVDIGTFE